MDLLSFSVLSTSFLMPFVSSVTARVVIADTAPDLVSGEPAGFEASEESVRIPSYNGGNGHFSYTFIVHTLCSHLLPHFWHSNVITILPL